MLLEDVGNQVALYHNELQPLFFYHANVNENQNIQLISCKYLSHFVINNKRMINVFHNHSWRKLLETIDLKKLFLHEMTGTRFKLEI